MRIFFKRLLYVFHVHFRFWLDLFRFVCGCTCSKCVKSARKISIPNSNSNSQLIWIHRDLATCPYLWTRRELSPNLWVTAVWILLSPYHRVFPYVLTRMQMEVHWTIVGESALFLTDRLVLTGTCALAAESPNWLTLFHAYLFSLSYFCQLNQTFSLTVYCCLMIFITYMR